MKYEHPFSHLGTPGVNKQPTISFESGIVYHIDDAPVITSSHPTTTLIGNRLSSNTSPDWSNPQLRTVVIPTGATATVTVLGQSRTYAIEDRGISLGASSQVTIVKELESGRQVSQRKSFNINQKILLANAVVARIRN